MLPTFLDLYYVQMADRRGQLKGSIQSEIDSGAGGAHEDIGIFLKYLLLKFIYLLRVGW